MTFIEAILTLVLVRLVYRSIVKAGRLLLGRGRPATA
jgi:hypothetical protein